MAIWEVTGVRMLQSLGVGSWSLGRLPAMSCPWATPWLQLVALRLARWVQSGQGPPGRGIAEGGSLLSVGERGRRPSRRPPGTAKNPRVLRCFVLFPFFPIFRILWLKMGQHGPT